MARPKSNAARGRGTVDQHVGRRIRERRITIGVTRHQLAELLHLTYQQVRKYECGINRVAAGHLFAIARALGTTTDYYFEGYEGAEMGPVPRQSRRLVQLATMLRMMSPEHLDALMRCARALSPTPEEA